MKSIVAIGTAMIAGLLVAAPAYAHPKLVSATPADKATASNVTKLSLTFSEKLVAPVSGLDLTMTGMPGMPDHVMPMGKLKTSVAADGKTLVATLPRALQTGTYKLDWHVVSVDTHKVAGTYSFSVR